MEKSQLINNMGVLQAQMTLLVQMNGKMDKRPSEEMVITCCAQARFLTLRNRTLSNTLIV